jgi:ribonuclease-3
MCAELEVLEGTIGHAFRDRHLLCRALTHRSHVHEKTAAGETGLLDNEQLEFLGDSILGFLVSESLVQHFPGLAEGRLSKLKAHLVSASHLHFVAQKLDLGRHLVLGRGEELSGGRNKKALLANGVEALLAALYLDAGMEAARGFVARYVVGDLDDLLEGTGLPVVDYKSALQEFAQARKLPQPRYTIVKERGPEHAKTFTVEVRVGREWSGQAEAFSKKSAGQKAAQVLLQSLIAGSVEDGGSPQEPAT